MEDFVQIKNSTIKRKPNSLKVKKQVIQDIDFTGSVYGQRKSITMPKDLDNLSMTFAKYDITVTRKVTTATVTNTENLAFNLCSVDLISKSGTQLMNIKPCYSRAVYKSLFGKPIFSSIENSISVDAGFYEAQATSPETITQTIYFPIPFFYSKTDKSFLSIRNLEDINVHFQVQSQANIGLVYSDASGFLQIDSVKVSLIQEAFNDEFTNKDMFQYGSALPAVPKMLKNTYNVFYEDVQDLASGLTEYNLLLRCPYPLMKITASIYNDASEFTINNFELKIKNNVILEPLDKKVNYSYYDENTTYTLNKQLDYWLNKENNVLSDTGLLTFSAEDSLYPAYLKLTFDSLSAAAKLRVHCTYLTNHEVNTKGNILSNTTESTLQTSNSTIS